MASFFPPLSWKQILHILFFYTFIATLVVVAINVGSGAAMYAWRDHIRVWWFPATLAGDLGITVLVEVWVTWLAVGSLAWTDVKKKRVEPIRRWATWPRKGPISPFLPFLHRIFPKKWQFLLSDPHMDIVGPFFSKQGWKFLRRLVYSSLNGLLLCIPFFIVWWPIGCGVAVAIWGNGDVPSWPEPQIFKTVYAVSMGLIISPLSAVAALAQAGLFEEDALRRAPASDVEGDGKDSDVEKVDDVEVAEPLPTSVPAEEAADMKV